MALNGFAMPARDCLVELRSGTDRPVFLVHGGIGNAVNLAPLAAALGGTRSIYGVEAFGARASPSAPQSPDHSIVAAAARYIREIRALQPDGPYTIGGYSIGGGIALEMAAQLRDASAAVDVVILLDAHPSLAPPPTDGRLAHLRANLRSFGVRPLLPWARRQICWKLGKRPDPCVLRSLACLEPERCGYVDLEQTLFALGRAHRVRDVDVDVDVVLVKAGELWPMYANDYGWSQWVRGRLQIEIAPGDHLNLLWPSNVAAVAAILDRWFA